MNKNGDVLKGDILVATHICPDAPTQDHYPVPFMDSSIDMQTNNEKEVDPRMDAIISIDTTKGNKVINTNGFAISPTIKSGYILEVSDDLLDVMTRVTGKLPYVFPVSQQDITPYGNDLHHLNSILQPATATDAPVVGVAITTEQPVAGCATGASHPLDVESAARFAVEVAKDYGEGKISFYNEQEYAHLLELYGEMKVFQPRQINKHSYETNTNLTTKDKVLTMKKSDMNNTPASRTQTKIGAITIGQSPRTDITGDICPLLAPNITLQEYGALDPFDADYINQNFAPGPDSSVLVTRMRDASQVIIGEEHILPLVQSCITRAEADGCQATVLLCTGKFPKLKHQKMLIIPQPLIHSVLKKHGR